MASPIYVFGFSQTPDSLRSLFIRDLPITYKRTAFGAFKANAREDYFLGVQVSAEEFDTCMASIKKQKTKPTPQGGPPGHNKNGREEVDDEFGDCIMSKEDLELIDFTVASALQAAYQKKLTAAGQEVAEHAAACMYFAVYKKLGFVQQVQGGSTTQEACTAVRSNIISLDGENDAREDHYKPMAGSVAAGFLPVD